MTEPEFIAEHAVNVGAVGTPGNSYQFRASRTSTDCWPVGWSLPEFLYACRRTIDAPRTLDVSCDQMLIAVADRETGLNGPQHSNGFEVFDAAFDYDASQPVGEPATR